jgi:hypothetical protein
MSHYVFIRAKTRKNSGSAEEVVYSTVFSNLHKVEAMRHSHPEFFHFLLVVFSHFGMDPYDL